MIVIVEVIENVIVAVTDFVIVIVKVHFKELTHIWGFRQKKSGLFKIFPNLKIT
jgi:hypothetical protein